MSYVTDPAIDDAGHVYQGVSYRDTLRFAGQQLISGTNGLSGEKTDCAVFSLTSTGHVRWVWQPRGTAQTRETRTLVYSPRQQSILLTIQFSGRLIAGPDTLDVPPVTTAPYTLGTALVSLSPAGQVRWARLIGQPSSTGSQVLPGEDLALDSVGNIALPGLYTGTGRIGAISLPAAPATQARAFITLLDTAGQVRWARTVSGFNESKGLGACFDRAGNVFCSGTYRVEVYFGSVLVKVPGAVSGQAYLAKYDPVGALTWVKPVGGGQTTFISRLTQHPSGDLLVQVTGATSVFGANQSGSSDNLIRLRPDGTVRWMRQTVPDVTVTTTCDRLGNIYVIGYYRRPTPTLGNSIMLPPAPPGTFDARGVIVMHDENGLPQWATTAQFFVSGGLENKVAVSPTGSVAVGGYVARQAVLHADTIRVQPPGVITRWSYLWQFRAPLTFGETDARLVCPGSSFWVPLGRDSTRFTATTSVEAQLSDATGSFTTPQVIGTRTGAASHDSILITIPATTPLGTRYRVRLLANTTPTLVSSGNGLMLEVATGAVARILAPDTVGACLGQPLPLLRGVATLGSALQWTLNGQPLPGATTDTLRPNQPGTYGLQARGSTCGNATSQGVEVRAYPVPTVTLAPFAPIAVTTTSYLLTGGSPAGGRWSGIGVTGSSFSPPTAGLGTHLVTYTYTNRFGCAASATLPLTVVPTVGLPEVGLVQQLDLSPNPARSEAHLAFTTLQPTKAYIQLFDALGRLVHEQHLASSHHHQATLTLPAATGVYRLRILMPTGIVSRTLLVQP